MERQKMVSLSEVEDVSMKPILSSLNIFVAHFFRDLFSKLSVFVRFTDLKTPTQVKQAERYYIKNIVQNLDLNVLALVGGADKCMIYESHLELKKHIVDTLKRNNKNAIAQVSTTIRSLKLTPNEDPAGNFSTVLLKCYDTLYDDNPEYDFPLDMTFIVKNLPTEIAIFYRVLVVSAEASTGKKEIDDPHTFLSRLSSSYHLKTQTTPNEGSSHDKNGSFKKYFKRKSGELNNMNVENGDEDNNAKVNFTQGSKRIKPSKTAEAKKLIDCNHKWCFHGTDCGYKHKPGQQREYSSLTEDEKKSCPYKGKK
jgi:hypothetical protein